MGELRAARICEVLREKIFEIFTRYLRDEMGFTTITGINLTPDMRYATVFYSVLGTEEEKKKTAIVLKDARAFINGQIGRTLHIKFPPVVRFEYDDTPVRATRVLELLNQIEEEKIENTPKLQKESRRNKKRSKRSKK